VNRFDKSGRPVASPKAGRPMMVSVLSGKGGVGKSVIAYNLAERAATSGYRTLLVDADYACGNLHILANTDPADGFEKFAQGQGTLNDLAVTLNENLYLLARSSFGPIESLSSLSQIARCAARLRQQSNGFDLVVVDHGSGINTVATVFAGTSDRNLLVMVPELTSISDCYGLYKYLRQTDHAIDCRPLLNRVESETEAEYLWARFAAVVEQFLKETPRQAGVLPEDTAFRSSVANQQPISVVAPDSPVLQALDKIIRALNSRSSAATTDSQPQEINVLTAPADIRE
jgi:flagellar biosynthesis protein FlhG